MQDEQEIKVLTTDKVLLRRAGRVLYITINRPQVMNAIDSETNQALADAMDYYQSQDALWVAVITGAGNKAFCAGGDISAMNRAAEGGEAYVVPQTGYAGLTSRFNLNKPVIAAVNGIAMGGGFEIALATDLIIAADTACFGLPEPKVGIVAYAAGMHRLPRQLGSKRAMQLLLTGEPIEAAKAMDWGLVNAVVPAENLEQEIETWVNKLLAVAPLAVRATKECVQQGLNTSLENAVKAQEQGAYPALEAMRHSQDILEGIQAFAQKRQPRWQGQ